jgi:hypothetical protein
MSDNGQIPNTNLEEIVKSGYCTRCDRYGIFDLAFISL